LASGFTVEQEKCQANRARQTSGFSGWYQEAIPAEAITLLAKRGHSSGDIQRRRRTQSSRSQASGSATCRSEAWSAVELIRQWLRWILLWCKCRGRSIGRRGHSPPTHSTPATS